MQRNAMPTLGLNVLFDTYFDNKGAREPVSVSPGFSVLHVGEQTSCKLAMQPHRLDCYMLCLIKSGEGIYLFDKKQYYLGPNTLCLVSPYVLTSWYAQTYSQDGYCCTFSTSFFHEGFEDKKWLDRFLVTDCEGHLVLSVPPQQMPLLSLLLEDMTLMYSEHLPSAELLRSLLQLLIRKIVALYPRVTTDVHPKHPAAIELTRDFIRDVKADMILLLKGEIATMPSLDEYAVRRSVSRNYMNDTIKSVTGRSAGQHIQQQLADQATILLKQTGSSIKEIAYLLGFNDTSYFSRFYKKHTGDSPTGIRSIHKL